MAERKERMIGTVNIGWAKIAWTYGVKELLKLARGTSEPLDHTFYLDKTRQVILQAGDTDTNAAIVGSLLGAVVGFTNLPSDFIKKMMSSSNNFYQNTLFKKVYKLHYF